MQVLWLLLLLGVTQTCFILLRHIVTALFFLQIESWWQLSIKLPSPHKHVLPLCLCPTLVILAICETFSLL